MTFPDKIGGFESNPEEYPVEKAALAFYDAVVSDGRFSWMGLIETRDELQRARMVIFLHKKAPSDPKIPQMPGKRIKDVGRAFEELYFALPPQVILDLYYNITDSEDEQVLVQRCLEDVRKRYGTKDDEAPAELMSSDSFL